MLDIAADGINNVLAELIPIVERTVSTITIPGISTEKIGFLIDVSNIVCNGFSIGSAAFSNQPGSAVDFTLNNLNVGCTASWSFKLRHWPHIPRGSGTIDIALLSSDAVVGVGISDDNGIPQVSGNVGVNIGELNFSFHGSLWDPLLNFVKDLFHGSIVSAVQSAVANGVTGYINNNVNARLREVRYSLPLNFRAPYNIAEVLFGLGQPVSVQAGYVGVGLEGAIVPTANPAMPNIPAPGLPGFQPAIPREIQLYLSEYTLLSGLKTFFDANLLNRIVRPRDIPLGLNETDAWFLIAPGFGKAYPKQDVQLLAAISELPTISITPAGVSVVIPTAITFSALTINGLVHEAFVLGATVYVDADVYVGNNVDGVPAILGSIKFIKASLTVESTAVGPVSVGLIQDLIDVVFEGVIVPAANAILEPGIPLPQAPGVSLVAPALAYGNGYILVETNFNFNPNEVAGEVTSYDYVYDPATGSTAASVAKELPAPKAAKVLRA